MPIPSFLMERPLRILVLADIHGNLPALEKVLLAEPRVDETWCLGDTVGYGAQPNECIELLRSQTALTCIAGNHDWGSVGKTELDQFNEDARHACEWTDRQLNDESRNFLESLEPAAVAPGAMLTHGSPRDPIGEYVFNMSIARPNFDYFAASLCFVAHSHVPLVFTRSDSGGDDEETIVPQPNLPFTLEKKRAIVNPGSVGQPRDGEPRSAYLIYEPEAVRFVLKRTAYDIGRAQAAIAAAGLPDRLAARLSYGW